MSELVLQVSEGGTIAEITQKVLPLVPQKVMEIHVEKKVIMEEKLVVAQKKAVELQVNATAASLSCAEVYPTYTAALSSMWCDASVLGCVTRAV